MRMTAALIGVAALAMASAASAQTVPTSFSPAFQAALEDDYGAREGAYLRQSVERAIHAAFARRGLTANDARIEVEIVNARPNRPTLEQLSARPGLDWGRSMSTGGAELRAVLRGPDGATLGEVEHRYFSFDIEQAQFNLTTWGDAHRSISRFAEKVADAYTARAR